MASRSDDPAAPRSRRHDEAVDVAARAAPAHGMAEGVFRDSVLAVRDDVEVWERALHAVEARRVKLKMRPGPGRSANLGQLPDVDAVDPWTIDVSTIDQTSRVMAWCPACLGSGAVKCTACRGAGRVKCSRCEGRGTDPQTGGPCGQCAGAKKLPCAVCHGNQIPCEGCHASGEVEAWIEVIREPRSAVVVHPMGAAARAHPRVSDAADFETEPSRWPDTLQFDSGPRGATDVAAALLPKLAPHERVVSTRLQRFQTVTHLVTYGTATTTGVVPVSGAPLAVGASADWRPANLRRLVVWGSLAVCLAASAAAAWAHLSSHAWYQRAPHPQVVGALAVVVAVALARTLAGLALRPQARTPLRLLVPAGALMLAVGATALVVVKSRPRASGVEAALGRGDLARAALEADALRLGRDRSTGESVLDDLHLRRVRAASGDLAAMRAEALRPWFTEGARGTAYRRVSEAITAAMDATPDDADALSSLADQAQPFSGALRELGLRRASMARARACVARADAVCAREHTNAAVQHGADPSETTPVLDAAVARMADAVRAKAAEAESTRDPVERAQRYEAAVALADRYATLGRAPVSPSPFELRDRLSRAMADRDAAARRAQRR